MSQTPTERRTSLATIILNTPLALEDLVAQVHALSTPQRTFLLLGALAYIEAAVPGLATRLVAESRGGS